MGGRACIQGDAHPVAVIVARTAHGATFEELLEGCPDLERADTQQALEYAAWLRVVAPLGAAVAAGTWWPFLGLPVVFLAIQCGVVRREERYLEAKLGRECREYKARAPRWP